MALAAARALATARAHLPLLVVLAVAAALRLATTVAYAPALLYDDSHGYLAMAFGHWPVSVAPLRPSGYPLALRALSVFGRGLEFVTVAQHLTGLVVAVLVYTGALRLGARRWVAVAAAALVALDAYAIALEQHVLAEAFFTLALTAAVVLSVGGRPSGRRLAAAGLLLAAAALMRPVALFAVPVWLAVVAGLHPGRRALLAGGGAVLAPILAYATLHAAVTGTFGLTQSNGWFLYGRVGPIVSCRPADVPASERALCRLRARDRGRSPSYYIFSRRSPAHRAFGGISGDARRQSRVDARLMSFSLGVIRQRPGEYAELVLGDLGRFFAPGVPSLSRRDDRTLRLPASNAVLDGYGDVVHTPRWLLAASALAALVALAVAPRAAALRLALPLGCTLAMLLGVAAAAGFALRYLLPAVPLLVVAGAGAAAELERAYARRRRPRATPVAVLATTGRSGEGVEPSNRGVPRLPRL